MSMIVDGTVSLERTECWNEIESLVLKLGIVYINGLAIALLQQMYR